MTRPRLRKIVGWTLVVVGFFALIAPIVPGAPLVFVGLELLGLRFLLTEKIRSLIQKKPLYQESPLTGTAERAG